MDHRTARDRNKGFMGGVTHFIEFPSIFRPSQYDGLDLHQVGSFLSSSAAFDALARLTLLKIQLHQAVFRAVDVLRREASRSFGIPSGQSLDQCPVLVEGERACEGLERVWVRNRWICSRSVLKSWPNRSLRLNLYRRSWKRVSNSTKSSTSRSSTLFPISTRSRSSCSISSSEARSAASDAARASRAPRIRRHPPRPYEIIGNVGASPRYHYDKAGQFELADRLTHRRAAHPEIFSELGLHQALAGFERPVDDRLTDGLKDQFAKGLIRIQLDGPKSRHTAPSSPSSEADRSRATMPGRAPTRPSCPVAPPPQRCAVPRGIGRQSGDCRPAS